MDSKKLEFFKEKLLAHKQQILNGQIYNSKDDLHVSSDDLADEADLASSVVNQQVSFSIREREMNKLRLIEMALYRIQEGQYGHCEDCDEEIEMKRLENQPWATLCLQHAEEREREVRFA